MPSRSDSKRARLQRWLAVRRPAAIDTAVLDEIKTALEPVSDSYLRDLIRSSGFAMTPDVEGVNTHTLEDLERTLNALAVLYETGRRDIRPLVIAAKDRLKWSMARLSDPAKKEMRQEMILWTLTWLENPAAFSLWVSLRRRAAHA
jgi:hypothetical protein